MIPPLIEAAITAAGIHGAQIRIARGEIAFDSQLAEDIFTIDAEIRSHTKGLVGILPERKPLAKLADKQAEVTPRRS